MDHRSLSFQIKCGDISQSEVCNTDISSVLTVCMYDSANLSSFIFLAYYLLDNLFFVD